MGNKDDLRWGVPFFLVAALLIGSSVARLATGWMGGDPPQMAFEGAFWLLGGLFGLAGWRRLSAAKAERPDLTWRQFLHLEPIP